MSNRRQTGTPSGSSSLVSQIVIAPFRRQTYRNVLYLSLQFPLSIAYFVTLVMLATTGIAALVIATEAAPGLLAGTPGGAVGVLVVGLVAVVLIAVSLPLLGLGIVGVAVGGVGLFTVDRAISERLLGRRVPSRPLSRGAFDNTHGFVLAFLTGAGTYLSLAAVLVKFPIGIAVFVVLVVSSILSVVLLAAPVLYDAAMGFNLEFTDGLLIGFVDGRYTVDLGGAGTWTIDTMPEAVVLSAGGLLTALFALNVCNLLAWLLGEATIVVARHATVFTRETIE